MNDRKQFHELDDAAERLWGFAVAIYEMAGVKPACLSIQARYGLSISTLLGCIWAGAEGYGRLGATEMETAIRRAVEWHREIIQPMRSLRRRLRQAPPAGLEERTENLRREVLAQELEAERIEQRLLLEDFVVPAMPAAAEGERWKDAVDNAALYTRKSCPRPESEAIDALALILGAVFPDVDGETLRGELLSVWRGGA